jgi:hypothetical protein
MEIFEKKKTRNCFFCPFRKTCEEYNKEFWEKRDEDYKNSFGF